MQNATFPLAVHPLIQSFLKVDTMDPYDEYALTQRMSNEIFPNLLYGRSDLSGVSIVSASGKVATSFQKNVAIEGYELYRNVPFHDNNFRIMGIRWIDSTPVLSVARRFIDMSDYKTSGMLIIDLKYRAISDMLDNGTLSPTHFVWAMNAPGEIVYHPDAARWGTQAPKPFPTVLAGKQSGHFTDSSSGTDKLLVYDYSPVTDWTLLMEVPVEELTGDFSRLRQATVVIGLLLIGLAAATIGSFTVSITRSLLLLKKLLNRAEQGDLDVRAPDGKAGEIGSLNRSFNTMVAELKRLIEVVHIAELKEKQLTIKHMEATLLALQTQITPHFLYNALEAVNSRAIEAEADDVSHMIASIAGMFRYSAGDPHKIVSLRDEMNHVALYLNIQQERYPYLRPDIRIREADLSAVDAVRLTVQPIVENAYSRGYEEHRLKPGYVGLFGERRDGLYVLTIVDKGKGMPPDTMQAYNRMFTTMTTEDIAKENRSEGKSIGLWNVHTRLRLTFGEPYGLLIRRSDADGTEVEIKLPWRREHV
ncbi:HAMP domain-containing protein [Paenibacillus hemerocallicola]|uniref:HAMP domain-containing protein n=1 Tax=Paenibacillus hemerocallicola TaxID=1172614 RepID=A0A5C4T3U5_9BACL|nr:histidine kinase [Paenibacillus hemerocallicola]TNJ63728.1 HAMP domain-containing protein [Paenibacillus hemerocallicola]